MNEADALDLARSAIWAVVIASGPSVIVAMIVGVGIALFQALTQIQEMTLTFIPKILAIFLTLIISAPFMGSVIFSFAQLCFSRVETGF